LQEQNEDVQASQDEEMHDGNPEGSSWYNDVDFCKSPRVDFLSRSFHSWQIGVVNI
jgi:hypothetical protein